MYHKIRGQKVSLQKYGYYLINQNNKASVDHDYYDLAKDVTNSNNNLVTQKKMSGNLDTHQYHMKTRNYVRQC